MEKPSTTLRILIVDADERQAAAVSRGLRELGVADVLAVTSGCAARAALERTEYDLLVADSALGDGQALALVRETQARWPSTVTILVVDCEQAQAESALEGGPAHHYVEKPFALHQLTDVIECLLSADGIPDPGARLVLKAVLGGDAQVGKTTLMQRLRTGRFQPDRAMTIGVDFHTYDTAVGDRSTRVVVWDLGGQERFSCTRRAFYRGARAVGLVFDLGNRNSFYNL
ncbi:MAG: response regulator, partial [Chloroflexi bacterium]|nr:response regulator [Chloroflexota bacterium]